MALQYLGDGEFIIGPDGVVVPPRDLSDAEATEHAAVIAASPRGAALYRETKKTKPADPAKEG